MNFVPTDKYITFKRTSNRTTLRLGMRCSFQAVGMMEKATGKPFVDIFRGSSIAFSTLIECTQAAMAAHNRVHGKPEPPEDYVYGLLEDGLGFKEVTDVLTELIKESAMSESEDAARDAMKTIDERLSMAGEDESGPLAGSQELSTEEADSSA